MTKRRAGLDTDVAARTPRLVISYARRDGEEFARNLRRRLVEEEGIPVWQDRTGMEGGRDWWLQIAEALDHVEFLVLVMTPAAMESDVVAKEWRYARQMGRCVYPVKAGANLDFAALPRWMRKAQFYDLEHDWRKFVNDLNTTCRAVRVPLMMPDLPADFTPRHEFEELLPLLLDPAKGEPVAITAALRGPGGYGKTTMAITLCHDERVQEAFDDGILWVTLGEDPGNLTGRITDLIEILTGERPGFRGIEAAGTRFAELIEDRDLLIVIDDVWNSAHLAPFLRGGTHCARLITTRNLDTLPRGTRNISVDRMWNAEAVQLLGSGIAGADAADLQKLARRLGEWPLLIKLVNGYLQSEIADFARSAPDAFRYVNRKLDEQGLLAFDAEDPLAREQAVGKTLGVSLDRLKADEERYPSAVARFCELAVFPEDAAIPVSVAAAMWGDGKCDEFAAEELCRHLYRRSLLLSFDAITRHIHLHDVVRKYLAERQAVGIQRLHQRLLDAYRPTSGDWADLPLDRQYLWENLAYHLIGASRVDELVSTVKDLRYLSAKTFLRKSAAAEADLSAALESCQDAGLVAVHRAYTQSVDLLNDGESRDDVAATLLSRVSHVKPLRPAAKLLERSLPRPYLVPSHRLPDLPPPALTRTLDSPRDDLTGCAINGNGAVLVTYFYDFEELVVWDVRRGTAYLELKGHRSSVTDCAIDAAGDRIASTSADGTLKIWDCRTGECLSTHVIPGGTSFCSMRGDGRQILAGEKALWLVSDSGMNPLEVPAKIGEVQCGVLSTDGTTIVAGAGQVLHVWHAGAYVRALKGHGEVVHSCAVSANGAVAVSGAEDKALRIWNTATGDSIICEHGDDVDDCDVTADGRIVIALSNYGPLALWDALTGAQRARLQSAHPTPAYACALNEDGSVAVSLVSDGTIKVWDGRSESGAEVEGLNSWACAAASDGTVAVAAHDAGLELWDSISGILRTTIHDRGMDTCAISDDGRIVAGEDCVWDLNEPGNTPLVRKGQACQLSGDGQWMVYYNYEQSLAVSATAGASKQVVLSGSGTPFALSRNGRVVAARASDAAKVWDAKTGEVIRTLHSSFSEVLCFSLNRDGTRLAATDQQGVTRVFDIASGAEICTLRGRADWLRGCAITDDGRWLVTASMGGFLALWDVTARKRVSEVRVTGFLFDCDWIPGTRNLVTVGTKGVFFFRVVGA